MKLFSSKCFYDFDSVHDTYQKKTRNKSNSKSKKKKIIAPNLEK